LLFSITLLFSGCAFHGGYTTNRTEVVLSEKNFKLVNSVQGYSKATYIFGIGGLVRQAMIAEARADMLSKANLTGAKAIVNEVVEVKSSLFPIVRTYEVTVSAHIVEFTE